MDAVEHSYHEMSQVPDEIYIAEYENKIVELHLYYFGRSTIRQIQLITGDDTILGDHINNTIQWLGRDCLMKMEKGHKGNSPRSHARAAEFSRKILASPKRLCYSI